MNYTGSFLLNILLIGVVFGGLLAVRLVSFQMRLNRIEREYDYADSLGRFHGRSGFGWNALIVIAVLLLIYNWQGEEEEPLSQSMQKVESTILAPRSVAEEMITNEAKEATEIGSTPLANKTEEWYLQIGVYKTEEALGRRMEDMKKNGHLMIVIEQDMINESIMWRLLLGPFKDSEHLNRYKMKHRLEGMERVSV